jgi:hypothetical protein
MRTVLAALALALAACAGVLAAGPASAAPAAAAAAARGQQSVPLKVTPRSALNQPEFVRSKPVTASTCPSASVRASIAEAGKEGKHYWICGQVSQGTPQGTASAAAPAPAVNPDISLSTLCAAAQQRGPNFWALSRLEQCAYPEQVTFTLGANGAILGAAHFNVYQDIHLNATTGIFTEVDTITFTSVTGAPALPAQSGALTFTSVCGSPNCTVTPAGAPNSTLISIGQSLNFGFEYRDTPSATTPDQFRNTYTLIYLPPGYVQGAPPPTYQSASPVRCDNELPGVTSAGCVFPAFTPTLELSLATYRAAAANVGAAEAVVAGAPGAPPASGSAGSPLTRGDPAKRDSNRAKICGSFVPLASVTNDSCDEYPFASTTQSGGARNLTGSACIELIPVTAPGGFGYTILRGAPGAPCEIGHVTNALNSLVGGSGLSPFFSRNRVAVGDSFYVAVTP